MELTRWAKNLPFVNNEFYLHRPIDIDFDNCSQVYSNEADKSYWEDRKVYICLCFGVTDSMVKDIVKDGAQSVRDVQRSCSAGKDCGTCIRALKEAVREESECLGLTVSSK